MRLRVCLVVCLFQPALPMRGVTPRFQAIGDTRQFQPVLPMRGVTGFSAHDEDILLFQPALPMRGVTFDVDRLASSRDISTRTPHAGSDELSCMFSA